MRGHGVSWPPILRRIYEERSGQVRAPGRGRVVVDAVGDGLSGGLSDGPQVAEVGAEGYARVTGGEVEHKRLAAELTGRGESEGAARREPRWYGEAFDDARGGFAPDGRRRLRSARAAEREPRWHKGGPRIEARIQRVSVEPQWQKGRARGKAAAAVAPTVAARTSGCGAYWPWRERRRCAGGAAVVRRGPQ